MLVNSVFPSGVNATPTTRSLLALTMISGVMVVIMRAVTTSQSFTVPSLLPVARSRSSGENAATVATST